MSARKKLVLKGKHQNLLLEEDVVLWYRKRWKRMGLNRKQGSLSVLVRQLLKNHMFMLIEKDRKR